MRSIPAEETLPKGRRRNIDLLRDAKKLTYEMETIIDIDGSIRSAAELSAGLWMFNGMRVRIRIEKV